jgi:hypothetical protein
MSHDNLSAAFPKLKKWHTKMTGRALGTVFEPIDYLPFDFDRLSSSLGTFVATSQSVSINGDAFSIRDGNLSPDDVDHFLVRLGLELAWAEVGADKKLQKIFEASSKTAAGQAARGFLYTAVKTRNKVAHSQGAVIELSGQEIDDSISSFEGIANGIDLQVTAFVDSAIAPYVAKKKAAK